jgi:hypothetical protein
MFFSCFFFLIATLPTIIQDALVVSIAAHNTMVFVVVFSARCNLRSAYRSG